MYTNQEDVRHNLKMFFLDGVSFMPSMALISITAVIPSFLNQLGATTFQIALAASMSFLCVLLSQPLFGFIASRSALMHKTFSKILFLQRFTFLIFILLIPIFAEANTTLVHLFLGFWAVFNLFVGSYAIFFTPLVIRLLPPDKRGGFRGIGQAIGSFIGVGMSALIPVILYRFAFPYNYMVIYALGVVFLFINAGTFFLLRENKDAEPTVPMRLLEYIKGMPGAVKESSTFRAMIYTCSFLSIANALLTYYTLFALRVFYATETHIALLTGLAILSTAITQIIFGYVADKYGPRITALICAIFVTAAGITALSAGSLNILFVAWVFANIANAGFFVTATLILGVVSPPSEMPLYVGVFNTITATLSTLIVLVLPPILEGLGFVPLFSIVLACGVISLMFNVLVLRRRMRIGEV
ncbi:MAG: MFS transporter [Oscillospiraceae bacterium]|nr:MFS transporter [Oscillospiraceae bacterium]MCL2279852.1 MFS transporter [Oscillospiraceae bacterium]